MRNSQDRYSENAHVYTDLAAISPVGKAKSLGRVVGKPSKLSVKLPRNRYLGSVGLSFRQDGEQSKCCQAPIRQLAQSPSRERRKLGRDPSDEQRQLGREDQHVGMIAVISVPALRPSPQL